MFDITYREADGINFSNQKIDAIEPMIANINEKLDKYDRDPSKFELSIFNTITLAKSEEEVNRLRKKHRMLKKHLKNSFIGHLEDVKERITKVEDMGISKIVLSLEKTELGDPLDVFSKEMM